MDGLILYDVETVAMVGMEEVPWTVNVHFDTDGNVVSVWNDDVCILPLFSPNQLTALKAEFAFAKSEESLEAGPIRKAPPLETAPQQTGSSTVPFSLIYSGIPGPATDVDVYYDVTPDRQVEFLSALVGGVDILPTLSESVQDYIYTYFVKDDLR